MIGPPPHTRLSDDDLERFQAGTHLRLWECLGAHPGTGVHGTPGCTFGVWAPSARQVSVIGGFNGWDPAAHPLARVGSSGIWEGFVEHAREGHLYKFRIVSWEDRTLEKSDPFARRSELAPGTASVISVPRHDWTDAAWMASRGERSNVRSPMTTYEVHLGSWKRRPLEAHRSLTYRELADELVPYVRDLGYTHVELLPVMEHPFFGSWGYQVTGFFAPTSRMGGPEDLMALVEAFHHAGIAVILDWVPSHFPEDAHGLGFFDGTWLYEHADPRKGHHPDWKTSIFNFGRPEVRSFLLSSALFWLEEFHADGLRVDAVASMLYLDYSRREGEWLANRDGGKENLEAIDFLRQLNRSIYGALPDIQTIAEESTSWPGVSRPTDTGGLGFGLKWDMGWMHDTLDYFAEAPAHRKHHHRKLTFRGLYAASENFVLPLSHDEVVHGKRSLLGRMPGDRWQRLANLRLLLGTMAGTPGKKLTFMGAEIGQEREWNHDAQLQWELLEDPGHLGVQSWVRDVNRRITQDPSLHEWDCDPRGFEWLDVHAGEHSVLAWLRWSGDWKSATVVVGNYTPELRQDFRVGVPHAGFWEEVLNSDAEGYGGSGVGNLGGRNAEAVEHHGRPASLLLTLPPLGIVFLRCAPPSGQARAPRRLSAAAESATPEGTTESGRAKPRKRAASTTPAPARKKTRRPPAPGTTA